MNGGTATFNPIHVTWTDPVHGEHDRVERFGFDFIAGRSSVQCGSGCCCRRESPPAPDAPKP